MDEGPMLKQFFEALGIKLRTPLDPLPIDKEVGEWLVKFLKTGVKSYEEAVIAAAQTLCTHRVMQDRHFPEFADVIQERMRQVELEGYTAKLDDRWEDGELAVAAAAYALRDLSIWPSGWSPKMFKLGEVNAAGRRRELVKAAALILAEISRLDRIPDVSKPLHSTGLPD
jgi:hypothetical protein